MECKTIGELKQAILHLKNDSLIVCDGGDGWLRTAILTIEQQGCGVLVETKMER